MRGYHDHSATTAVESVRSEADGLLEAEKRLTEPESLWLVAETLIALDVIKSVVSKLLSWCTSLLLTKVGLSWSLSVVVAVGFVS